MNVNLFNYQNVLFVNNSGSQTKLRWFTQGIKKFRQS